MKKSPPATSRITPLFVGALALAPFVACGEIDTNPQSVASSKSGAAPADDVKGISLLARVEKAEGGRVEFYEPVPGHILVHETSLDGTIKSPSQRGLKAAEIFQAVSPGQLIPQALLDAQKRADARKAPPGLSRPHGKDSESVEPTTKGNGIESSQHALSSTDHSTTSGCTLAGMQASCNAAGSSDWIHCAYNRNANAWIQRVDTWAIYDRVCVPSSQWVQRKSEYKTWYSWSTYGTFTVLSGTTDYVHLADYSFDFDYKSTIFDVAPDTYHWVAHGLR